LGDGDNAPFLLYEDESMHCNLPNDKLALRLIELVSRNL